VFNELQDKKLFVAVFRHNVFCF